MEKKHFFLSQFWPISKVRIECECEFNAIGSYHFLRWLLFDFQSIEDWIFKLILNKNQRSMKNGFVLQYKMDWCPLAITVTVTPFLFGFIEMCYTRYAVCVRCSFVQLRYILLRTSSRRIFDLRVLFVTAKDYTLRTLILLWWLDIPNNKVQNEFK